MFVNLPQLPPLSRQQEREEIQGKLAKLAQKSRKVTRALTSPHPISEARRLELEDERKRIYLLECELIRVLETLFVSQRDLCQLISKAVHLIDTGRWVELRELLLDRLRFQFGFPDGGKALQRLLTEKRNGEPELSSVAVKLNEALMGHARRKECIRDFFHGFRLMFMADIPKDSDFWPLIRQTTDRVAFIP